MARPKAFDQTEVLDRAMDLFWRQGYEATSIQNLVDHMGINRGSMYETFGDKHALFQRALNRYLDRVIAEKLEAVLAASDPLQGLRAFFEDFAEQAERGEAWRGCFLVNAIVELSPRCERMRSCTREAMDRLESFFRERLQAAAARGELSLRHEPVALARYLACFLQGLAVQVKSRPDPQAIRESLRVGLAILA